VVLRPKLLISHARDIERANRILEKAEKNCLISNSIRQRQHLSQRSASPASDSRDNRRSAAR
jgi:organic hydroperoxide reductase OsmC/OhrA